MWSTIGSSYLSKSLLQFWDYAFEMFTEHILLPDITEGTNPNFVFILTDLLRPDSSTLQCIVWDGSFSGLAILGLSPG